MKNKRFNITYCVIALLFGFSTIKAQEFDLSTYRIMYNLSAIKQADNSRQLSVNYLVRHKKNRKDRIPVYEGQISFINYNDEQEVILGSSTTDKEGNAVFIIPENYNYLTDSEGYINLEARFDKTDFLPKKSANVRFKDINLTINLEEIDSVRTVIVKAFVKDSLGTSNPVDELDIKIAVNSMFSNMTIEEASMDNGAYHFIFPTDLPGDLNGNLTVYAIIEDHDDFGDVIQEENAVWGLARPNSGQSNRMLWSSAAPYWMYVVLSIMLVGVWANYVYTIYNLYKLKKEGELLEYN